MDVFEKLHDRYAALASASYHLDGGQRKNLVSEFQSRWDDGERFVARGGDAIEMFLGTAKRDADTEEELAACVDELASRIKDALVAQWAKQYDRPQMIGILNAITNLDVYATLNVYDVVVRPHEIAWAWNKMHPEAEPICSAPSIEI